MLCKDFLNSLEGSAEIRIFLNYFIIKNIYKQFIFNYK